MLSRALKFAAPAIALAVITLPALAKDHLPVAGQRVTVAEAAPAKKPEAKRCNGERHEPIKHKEETHDRDDD